MVSSISQLTVGADTPHQALALKYQGYDPVWITALDEDEQSRRHAYDLIRLLPQGEAGAAMFMGYRLETLMASGNIVRGEVYTCLVPPLPTSQTRAVPLLRLPPRGNLRQTIHDQSLYARPVSFMDIYTYAYGLWLLLWQREHSMPSSAIDRAIRNLEGVGPFNWVDIREELRKLASDPSIASLLPKGSLGEIAGLGTPGSSGYQILKTILLEVLARTNRPRV